MADGEDARPGVCDDARPPVSRGTSVCLLSSRSRETSQHRLSEGRFSAEAGADGADGADGAGGADPRVVSFIRPSSSREDGEDGGVENGSCQETSAGETWYELKSKTLFCLIPELVVDGIFLFLVVCMDTFLKNLIFTLPVLTSPHHLLRLKK